MSKEYVVDGAQLECTLGVTPGKLVVSPGRLSKLKGKNKANIGDCSIIPFGACKIISPPKLCTPTGVRWIGGKTDTLIEGLPALLDSDKLLCTTGGGIITIKYSGQ
jgi:hypothetical protein